MKIDIKVKVTYSVGLGDIDVSQEVLTELQESCADVCEVDELKHAEAYWWLVSKIKEKDCYDWNVEIEHLKVKE